MDDGAADARRRRLDGVHDGRPRSQQRQRNGVQCHVRDVVARDGRGPARPDGWRRTTQAAVGRAARLHASSVPGPPAFPAGRGGAARSAELAASRAVRAAVPGHHGPPLGAPPVRPRLRHRSHRHRLAAARAGAPAARVAAAGGRRAVERCRPAQVHPGQRGRRRPAGSAGHALLRPGLPRGPGRGPASAAPGSRRAGDHLARTRPNCGSRCAWTRPARASGTG